MMEHQWKRKERNEDGFRVNIRAALFDMDGLLFDTENLFLSCSRETKQELGYSIPHDLHVEAIGRTFQDAKRIFIEHLGEDFPMESFLQMNHQRVYAHIERYGIPVKPGAISLLKELRRRGIKTLLVSSSGIWMIEKNLKAADMEGFFDLIVSGEEVEHGKPAPDIFLLAAERGQFAPEECLVLEDSNNGVKAGVAAGMRTVMVPDIKPPLPEVEAAVYKVFKTLEEVHHHLSSLLSPHLD
ncbi:MAG TPA: HAD family phosphatase [Clostridia bacterium]|nr:HAD family phosphatase [Clostridia bacterium]